MKRIVLFLALLFLTATIGFSQNENTNVNRDDKNTPYISFNKTVHDYGTIEWGGNGTYKFEFTNTGKNPLLLSNVRSSCGCTVPKWPKEPIRKGEKAYMEVRYNTRIIGNFSKSVTVYSNASNSPVLLRIKGMVEKRP